MNKASISAAILLAAFLNSTLAAADTIPLCGYLCFHSTDSTRVDVTMTHELQPDRQVHLSLPRSAIVFVSGYDPLAIEKLPDRIATDGKWLTFAIVISDGRPIGEAVADYSQQNAVSLDSAATELRPDYALIDISIIGRDVPDERLYSAYLLRGMDWTDLKSAEPFDGLPAKILSFQSKNSAGTMQSATGHRTNYFPASAGDPFLMIQCDNEPNPVYWCDYFVRPNDVVKLTIQMPDFRAYGGRQFIRDRLNMVLRAYCDYDVGCNP
jgi:hypothetical protein